MKHNQFNLPTNNIAFTFTDQMLHLLQKAVNENASSNEENKPTIMESFTRRFKAAFSTATLDAPSYAPPFRYSYKFEHTLRNIRSYLNKDHKELSEEMDKFLRLYMEGGI